MRARIINKLELKPKPKVSAKQKLVIYVSASLISGLVASFFFIYFNTANIEDAQAAGIPVIINGYARATGITGNTINVQNASVSEVAGTGTFAAGGRAILVQVQDNVIGTTADNVNFGNVGNIESAGLYEIITISSVTRNGGGNLTSVIFEGTLTNSYNIGGRTRLQLVTFPTLNDGSGNYTTTSDITALDWNGNVGGVVALSVNSTLTLLHDIYTDGKGFRGGAANGGGSNDNCMDDTYRIDSQDDYADKGEGIYSNTAARAAARGKIINGGGGGNSHNAGGGGGGNYSAGGDGGPGWQDGDPGYCNPSSGGIGGIALSSYITSNRIFMGGGGGAGEGNNGNATPGANGGGIIFIAAQTLFTNTSCTGGYRISANGDAAPNTTDDGAGGAGAGGSILLDIANFNINSLCPLSIQANGGDGGSVDHNDTHGGGGGGGMGVIMVSVPTPINNVFTLTDPGTGGANDNSGSFVAAPGGGAIGGGEGVTDNSNLILPVELIDFTGRQEHNRVYLSWSTASEKNNDYFDIEMSIDGKKFANVGQVKGYGSTNETQEYQFQHFNQFTGIRYYRLKQVDFDGQFEYSKVIYVESTLKVESLVLNVFPNPSAGKDVTLQIGGKSEQAIEINIINSNGESALQRSLERSLSGSWNYKINHGALPPGVYWVQVNQEDQQLIRKLLITN